MLLNRPLQFSELVAWYRLAFGGTDGAIAKRDRKPAQVVASSYVAEYMGDTPAYIRRLHDLTEPGGRAILLDVLTDPENTAGGVTLKVLLRSFALICQAYLRLGKVPPLCQVARCMRLYRIFQEPAFRALHSDYHARYHFPRAAWMAERQSYPGATSYDLGMIGLLILPKPL